MKRLHTSFVSAAGLLLASVAAAPAQQAAAPAAAPVKIGIVSFQIGRAHV